MQRAEGQPSECLGCHSFVLSSFLEYISYFGYRQTAEGPYEAPDSVARISADVLTPVEEHWSSRARFSPSLGMKLCGLS